MSDQRKKRPNSGLKNRIGSTENVQKNGREKQTNSQAQADNTMNKYQRQQSYDNVRRIVQKEGRTARNLITWSVPVEHEDGSTDEYKQRSSRQPRQRTHSAPRIKTSKEGPAISKSSEHRILSQSLNLPQQHSLDRTHNRRGSRPQGKERDTSLDHSGSGKKGDLRARYWAFLFDNLRRAVDEIYSTCETDESVVECKEVIMMLEQCTKDFKSLIQRLNLLRDYENADVAKRPTSLAWEVRKMSPGKSLSSAAKEKHIPSPTVSRSLNFGQSQQPYVTKQRVASWADRVKGFIDAVPEPQEDPSDDFVEISTTPLTSKEDKKQTEPEKEEDTDGWETVQRGKMKRTLSTGSRSSVSSVKASGDLLRYPPPTPTIYTEKPNNTATNEGLVRKDSDKENQLKKESVEGGKERVGARKDSSKCHNVHWQENPTQPTTTNVENTETVEIAAASSKTDAELKSDTDVKEDVDELNVDADEPKEDDPKELGDDSKDEELIESALQSVLAEEEQLAEELVKENEAALAEATKEEATYLQEIQMVEEQDAADDDVVDDDDLTKGATDAHLTMSHSSNVEMENTPMEWNDILQQHDAESTSGMSWGDMVEEEERTTSRTPGRVVHIHEKLSSPSRKRSQNESKKRHEEKQAKAQELREKLKKERSERVRLLSSKVEEVRGYKSELLEQKRLVMSNKLRRVEEKRQQLLSMKSRKAAQEETKANEIAFINTLEAQNKKHDIIVKHQESEARLHDIQEERQKKNEEKAAKEAAVEERRKAIQAERLAKLSIQQEKKKEKEKEFEQRQLEKEKERLELARAKEREREERMAALNKKQQDNIEELQKKIKMKQDDSDKRHKEMLEKVREKAFEMTIMRHSTEDHNDAPTHTPYDQKKLCAVCNVMIPSEVFLLSHLRGKKHQQALDDTAGGRQLSKTDIESFNLKHIQDAPPERPDPQLSIDKERQKALKKRCKKLRQRMAQRGAEYENALSGKQQPSVESANRAKLQKVVKDVNKYLAGEESGPWPVNKVAALDRSLGELTRILEKRVSCDQLALRVCGGMTALSRVVLLISANGPTPLIPNKSLVHACSVIRLSCEDNYENCHYMLFSNKAGSLVDLLALRLNSLLPDSEPVVVTSGSKLPHDPVASSLMELLATILTCISSHSSTSNSGAKADNKSGAGDSDALASRAVDIVSYMVSVGTVDRLAVYFSSVRGHIDDNPPAATFLHHCMQMLSALANTVTPSHRSVSVVFCESSKDDPSHLIISLRATGLMGLVSLMYGMLLHSGAPSRGDQPPPQLPPHTVTVLTMGFRVLNHLALLSLHLLQGCLGEEGTSLELRHIASYLLWYCSHHHDTHSPLLHQVILTVGYFTVLHQDNQMIIQSGQPPTVLQQLCCLPFQYFSDPQLSQVLFPTLISCCYLSPSNTQLLQEELSAALLANFIEEKTLEGQESKLLQASTNKQPGEKEEELRMALEARFPQKEWSKAKEFFTTFKKAD